MEGNSEFAQNFASEVYFDPKKKRKVFAGVMIAKDDQVPLIICCMALIDSAIYLSVVRLCFFLYLQ